VVKKRGRSKVSKRKKGVDLTSLGARKDGASHGSSTGRGRNDEKGGQVNRNQQKISREEREKLFSIRGKRRGVEGGRSGTGPGGMGKTRKPTGGKMVLRGK